MKNKKYFKKYLIFGYGNMGKRYYDLLKTIHPECDIVAMTRNDSFDGMKGEKFDAAFVCTPSEYHLQNAYLIIEEISPMPILIEKPMSTLKDSNGYANSLGQISMNHNIAIYIAFNLRFTDNVQNMAQYVSSNTNLHLDYYPLAVCRTDCSRWPGKREKDHVIFELQHELDYLTLLFGTPAIVKVRGGESRSYVQILHANGIKSFAYLDMISDKEERYFTTGHHGMNSHSRFIFRETDIELSYFRQLRYFLDNLNNPAISNGILNATRWFDLLRGAY